MTPPQTATTAAAPPASSVKGQLGVRVATHSGKPLKDAIVNVVGIGNQTTDAAGLANFGEVAIKTYDITAEKAGYQSSGAPQAKTTIAVVAGTAAAALQLDSTPVLIKAEDGTSAPCTAVPTVHFIKLKAVPQAGLTGSFAWSTPSTKLTLADVGTDTVTVTAGNAAGTGVGSESVQVTFTPTGDPAADPVSVGITVFTVVFSAAPTQKYGYDEMNTASNETPHVSVKQNDSTLVHVTIAGGATGADLIFTTDDASIADATDPGSAGAAFDLTINGKNQTKSETKISARAKCCNATSCAKLAVNVYAQKAVSATVAKIWDSTSSSTQLSRGNFDVKAAERLINTHYSDAVIVLTLTDQSATGGVVDVPYDLNSNGSLDIEPGTVSTEMAAINTAFNPTGQKVVVVKEIAYIFYLSVAANIGDTTLTLKTTYGGNVTFLPVGQPVAFGAGATQEMVTIASKSANVLTLSGALTKAHPVADGVRFVVAGLGGNPILLSENFATSADLEGWTIGHECGHALMHWADLDAADDLMNNNTGWTDHRLRFKDQPHHYDTNKENQWELVAR